MTNGTFFEAACKSLSLRAWKCKLFVGEFLVLLRIVGTEYPYGYLTAVYQGVNLPLLGHGLAVVKMGEEPLEEAEAR